MASAIPTMGLGGYLLTIITGAQYFATPENEWGLHILPHLPQWMVPQDPNAVKWFFVAAPSGGGVPWKAWVDPLCYWPLLIVALYLVMISSMVILRRHWKDRAYAYLWQPTSVLLSWPHVPTGSSSEKS